MLDLIEPSGCLLFSVAMCASCNGCQIYRHLFLYHKFSSYRHIKDFVVYEILFLVCLLICISIANDNFYNLIRKIDCCLLYGFVSILSQLI